MKRIHVNLKSFPKQDGKIRVPTNQRQTFSYQKQSLSQVYENGTRVFPKLVLLIKGSFPCSCLLKCIQKVFFKTSEAHKFSTWRSTIPLPVVFPLRTWSSSTAPLALILPWPRRQKSYEMLGWRQVVVNEVPAALNRWSWVGKRETLEFL